MRTLEDLRALRDAGSSHVVMGTAAVLNRELRMRAIDALGEALVVAVDARGSIVATHGWQHESGRDVLDLAAELEEDGVASVLYTDVARDGMNTGAALEGTAEVAAVVPTIASGGVRDAQDIVALSNIPGVTGTIVGTALYEGSVTLEELLEATGER